MSIKLARLAFDSNLTNLSNIFPLELVFRNLQRVQIKYDNFNGSRNTKKH